MLRKSSAPGSEAARDKWLLQKKSHILRKKFCPMQRSCPGQVVFSKKKSDFEKNLPQAAKLPRTSGLFKQNEKKFCPRQRSCPGQVVCSKKSHVLRKSSAPGSEAALDKWPLQKESDFWEKNSAPGSEAARDKWLLRKKSDFWEKVQPQAAKLSGTSGFFKTSIFWKKFCPRQRSCTG